jgi:hypothetical protein
VALVSFVISREKSHAAIAELLAGLVVVLFREFQQWCLGR